MGKLSEKPGKHGGKHGGKRCNAGRRQKSEAGPSVILTASVPPEQAAWVDSHGLGRSAAIQSLIAAAQRLGLDLRA